MERKILNRIRTANISWGKPQTFATLGHSKYFTEEEGVYLISQTYTRGGEQIEKYVYVGETRKGFPIRIMQHVDSNKTSRWFSEGYGELKIRFGHIDFPSGLVDRANWAEEIKWVLLTIETTLIQYLRQDTQNVKLKNVRQVNSWTIYYDLIIRSRNCQVVPCIMETRRLYNEIVEKSDGIIVGKGNINTIHWD